MQRNPSQPPMLWQLVVLDPPNRHQSNKSLQFQLSTLLIWPQQPLSIKYQKIAADYNINSYFIRPAHLSGSLISDNQVIDHALKFTEKYNKEIYDIIIYLQPTSPLRRKIDITKAVKYLILNNLDSVWSVSRVDKKFHPLKVLFD